MVWNYWVHFQFITQIKYLSGQVPQKLSWVRIEDSSKMHFCNLGTCVIVVFIQTYLQRSKPNLKPSQPWGMGLNLSSFSWFFFLTFQQSQLPSFWNRIFAKIVKVIGNWWSQLCLKFPLPSKAVVKCILPHFTVFFCHSC